MQPAGAVRCFSCKPDQRKGPPEGGPFHVCQQLNARSPITLALASKFDVQPQDVVFVGPADITRWNRFITQLLPTGQFIYIGASTKNQASN